MSLMLRMVCPLLLLTLASLATALPVCSETHGFAGEPSATFELEVSQGLAPGQALVLYARGIGQGAAVQVSAGGKLSQPDQALVLTVLPPAPITISVQRGSLSWDVTPFSFVSYIANSDVCRISLTPATMAVPLVAIDGHPANAFLQIVPQAPNLYFTVSVSGASPVLASYNADRAAAPEAGTSIPMNAQVPGMFATVSSPMYITARAAEQHVDPARFVITQSQSAPAGFVAPGSKPATWKEAAKEKAVETENFFGWFISRLIILAIGYIIVRSAINYKNGIRTFPELVPHHEQFGEAITVLSGTLEKIRGGSSTPLGATHSVAPAGMASSRRGYEQVSGYQP